ncbi:MAG: hypothetical protein E6R13_01665, partial [Spirochaetes bacterium]
MKSKKNKYDKGGKLKEALSVGFNDGTELPSATTNKPFFGSVLRGSKQDIIPNSAENSIINFNNSFSNSNAGDSPKPKIYLFKKNLDYSNLSEIEAFNLIKDFTKKNPANINIKPIVVKEE